MLIIWRNLPLRLINPFFSHQPEISLALDFIFTLDTFIWKIIFLTRSSKLEKFDRVFLN